MSSVWGNNIKISIFGESHSNAVGVTIDGLPPGIEIDLNEINHQLLRRKSIDPSISTPRTEPDDFEILSGFFNNKTTGSPLCAIFKNQKINSKPYDDNLYIPRPNTADFTSSVRYKNNNDFRGGGHNSARLTVGLVFAGSICYQILKSKFNVCIGSHILKLYNKKSEPFNKCNISYDLLHKLSLEYFPVIKKNDKIEYINILHQFRQKGNTIGGTIEVAVIGLPAGIGSPIFGSLESKISSLLFAVPAVKSVDFDLGISDLDGENANDEFYFDENLKISTKTNNHCGILGGISSGLPIVLRVSFKPIPSILKPQKTIDLKNKKNTILKISGNHDVSPVVRSAPIVESVLAISILDSVYEQNL